MNHDEYLWYKERGFCTACRKNKAAIGRVRCADCIEKSKKQKFAYYRAHKQQIAEYHEEYSKRVYEERKADGVCARCGKREPEPGKYSCTECLRKNAQYRKDKLLRNGYIPRWLAVDLLYCSVCKRETALEGKKTCASCYRIAVANLAKAQQAQARRLNNG